ncbi:MAG: type II toxin-antitoxin system RelE/ParE family toxin [Patescibacteria group bacterium]
MAEKVTPGKWEIEFFESARGEKIVESFLSSLEHPTRAKLARLMDLLQKYGPSLGMPHSKMITSGLCELRVRGKIEIRIFYTFKGKFVYFLHAFKKQSQKTPDKEIETANQRLKLI